MCVVSMVTDHYQKQWPPMQWPLPGDNPITDNEFLKDFFKFKSLKKKAEEIDKATGQKDCIAPEKDKFIKELEKRVAELEKALKKKKRKPKSKSKYVLSRAKIRKLANDV